MIAKSPDFEEALVAEVFGIPLRWFQQIDAACDVFLSNPKHQPAEKHASMRDQISHSLELAVRRKAARDKLAA